MVDFKLLVIFSTFLSYEVSDNLKFLTLFAACSLVPALFRLSIPGTPYLAPLASLNFLGYLCISLVICWASAWSSAELNPHLGLYKNQRQSLSGLGMVEDIPGYRMIQRKGEKETGKGLKRKREKGTKVKKRGGK